MDIRHIIEAVKAIGADAPERGEDCLPPERLAGYFDGQLDEGERTEAEAHLADCDYCLGQVATLSRSRGGAQPEGVPASLVQEAERLGSRAPRLPVRNAHRWATAALLVLAIGAFALLFSQGGDPGLQSGERQTRLVERQPLQPALLAPREGSVIQPLEQVFRWSEVPGSLFYDVRLVSSDGDLLLRQRVEETRWLIPEGVQLASGEEYFVRVDAYLSEAKYLSSEHVVFTVGGQD